MVVKCSESTKWHPILNFFQGRPDPSGACQIKSVLLIHKTNPPIWLVGYGPVIYISNCSVRMPFLWYTTREFCTVMWLPVTINHAWNRKCCSLFRNIYLNEWFTWKTLNFRTLSEKWYLLKHNWKWFSAISRWIRF